MTGPHTLTPAQRQREQALLYTLISDILITILIAAVALLSGSLTMGAELTRVVLLIGLEIFSFIALWRIHRGRFADFEYGHGKIEQLASIGIAAALLIGGVMVFSSALASLTGATQPVSPLGLAAAASIAGINTCQNFLAWDAMRRAAKVEANAILVSQMQARWVKLVSSVVVQLALTIAALTHDAVVAHWLDGFGALFVASFMVSSAIGMLRSGLPDLLDRCIGEEAHLAILRVLSGQFDNYSSFDGVRTRSAAGRYFVEVSLGYPASLPFAEVDRRRNVVEEGIRDALGDCDVTVKVRSEPPNATGPG